MDGWVGMDVCFSHFLVLPLPGVTTSWCLLSFATSYLILFVGVVYIIVCVFALFIILSCRCLGNVL